MFLGAFIIYLLTDGKLLRLLFSLPSGNAFKYSVSFLWAIPTPQISPFFAIVTPSSFDTIAPSES